MPIAHICQQCGQGLGRIRPQRDPYYDLPIVTCPVCQWSCVRRRLPSRETWKHLQRKVWVFGLMILKASLSLLLFGLTLGAIFSLQQGEFEIGRNVNSRAFVVMLVLMLLVLPLVTGAWLTFAFSHLRRRTVFVAWGLALAIVVLLIITGMGLAGEAHDVSYEDWKTMSISALAWSGLREMALPCLGLLALMMLVSRGGIPLGRVSQSVKLLVARWHWRWMMRRRRLRRSIE